MSGILGKILSGGVGELVESVGNVIDKFHTSDSEKAEAKLKVEQVITQRMAVIEQSIQARFAMVQGVIESEMKSGNGYTKNARPTIVYTGLLIHLINAIGPMFGLAAVDVDPNFTYVWGGVCGVWIVGRSAERMGMGNRATKAITGTARAEL